MSSKILLAIETSSLVCGAAIIKEERILSLIEKISPREHAEILPGFIQKSLLKSRITLDELDGIALNIGPGSFTGLRIGLGISKGITYAKKLPIIPVPSLLSLAFTNKKNEPKNGILYSHAKKVFYQEFIWINGIPFEKSKPTVDNIENYIGELNGGFQYNCESILKSSEKLEKVIPSAGSIGLLGSLFYNDWAINDTYELVPNYISPFKVKSH